MQRELSTFPLAPSMKFKLAKAGFLTVDDAIGFKPSELAKIIGVDTCDALELQQFIRGESAVVDNQHKPSTTCIKSTAWDLVQAERRTPIVSFCQSLDDLVGGGVPCGKITEFAGAPGIGKTQLCIQLAVDVQIPDCFGGVEGEAFYIDTEGSFIVDRVVDMAEAMVQHCQYMSVANDDSTTDSTSKNAADKLTVESILAHIHYSRCLDHVQLLATIHKLNTFVKEHPRIKLIIIDSIAFPFRSLTDYSLRTRVLNSAAQTLNNLAATYGLAVVLTNQMTTRFGGGGSQLIPALGESWGHSCAVRVVLRWEKEERRALLYKSPANREAEVAYQITAAGVRDIIR